MRMGIENNVIDRKGKDCNKSNSKKKRQKKVFAVQKLYETCREVFADCGPGVVPSPENVERLKAVLDGMTEADVGLRPNMPFFQEKAKEPVPRITYLHLYECVKFSIAIFCLPPGSEIPLHNHPGMTVFSKLLFGTMHIKSYDWAVSGLIKANNTGPPEGGVRLARVKVNSEFTAPCSTSILYPANGGNMHCFRARTACAVLDVLGPPYCDPDGRHCQYYSDFPFTMFAESSGDGECKELEEEDKERHAWLKEREKPEDVVIVGCKYTGPKIVAKR